MGVNYCGTIALFHSLSTRTSNGFSLLPPGDLSGRVPAVAEITFSARASEHALEAVLRKYADPLLLTLKECVRVF